MRTWLRALITSMPALSILLTACGALVPPESCGEGIGTTVDEAAFDRHFRTVDLISGETGLLGELRKDDTPVFSPDEELLITVMSRGQVEVFACVQERKGRGNIVAERLGSLEQGPSRIPLGTFEEGSYVVRVIVGKDLVKNLPFEVEQLEE